MVHMDSSMNIILNVIPTIEGTIVETHRGSYLCDHGVTINDFGTGLCPGGPGVNHWLDDGDESISALRTKVETEYESIIDGYLQWGAINDGFLKLPLAHPTRVLQNR